MFRTLRDKGIISYTEYLFLLSILTSKNRIYLTKLPTLNICDRFLLSEPKSGFKIAFNMFDTDGSNFVDKNEFLVVSTINIIILKELKKTKKKESSLHSIGKKISFEINEFYRVNIKILNKKIRKIELTFSIESR